LAGAKLDLLRLIENGSDVLSILNAETGAILFESPSARRILGYAPDDMIGQDVFAFVHPDDLTHQPGIQLAD